MEKQVRALKQHQNNPLNGPLSRTNQAGQYQKKTFTQSFQSSLVLFDIF